MLHWRVWCGVRCYRLAGVSHRFCCDHGAVDDGDCFPVGCGRWWVFCGGCDCVAGEAVQVVGDECAGVRDE